MTLFLEAVATTFDRLLGQALNLDLSSSQYALRIGDTR